MAKSSPKKPSDQKFGTDLPPETIAECILKAAIKHGHPVYFGKGAIKINNIGDIYMSDESGKIIVQDVKLDHGSALTIGRARDVNAYSKYVQSSKNLDDSTKKQLQEARSKLEQLELSENDKDDATDDLQKLTSELENKQPNPSRVSRLFRSINDIAPEIANIIKLADSIKNLLT